MVVPRNPSSSSMRSVLEDNPDIETPKREHGDPTTPTTALHGERL